MVDIEPIAKVANPRSAKAQTFVAHPDRVLLVLVLLVLLGITSLPYLYGSLISPADRRFMGIVIDVPDTTQYFAWLRAHQQSLIVSNTMTPEPNQPAFFNLLWLALGRLALWTGMGLPAVLHVLRVVAGLAFGSALFWFYGLLAENRRERLLSTLLVLIGGGVGWIWVVEKYLAGRSELLYPLDVYVAEPNALLSLIGYPHFLLAGALLFAVLGLFLQAARSGRFAPYVLAAMLALLLALHHAYDLITIYAVLGGYLVLRWWVDRRLPGREAAGLLLIGAVSSPPAAYFAYLTSQDPLWREVLDQFSNAGVFTPNPLHLLILLGPQLPLAAAALPELTRRRSAGDLLLLSWAVVGFGLLYIPTDFQIHMLNPYQVPLAILAVRLLCRYAAATSRRSLLRLAPAALLLVAALVNVYLLTWRFVDLSRQRAPYYLHTDEVAALQWLDRQQGDGVVLATENLGQYVPALAGKRAVIAHWAQTVDYYTKRDETTRFFDPATSAGERAAILRRYGVAYVLAGEDEIHPATLVGTPLQLEPVFRRRAAVVYRVVGNEEGALR